MGLKCGVCGVKYEGWLGEVTKAGFVRNGKFVSGCGKCDDGVGHAVRMEEGRTFNGSDTTRARVRTKGGRVCRLRVAGKGLVLGLRLAAAAANVELLLDLVHVGR